ncbi:MAG TPA: PIN domain-containing protein [Armatimonadetes bacterium]|nr:PIN domain-containing protein [Armatimonadota bacterium]
MSKRIRRGLDVMVDSSAVRDENWACPNLWRRSEVARLRQLASVFQPLNDCVVQRTRKLVDEGFSPFDALHLALAEAAGVDYFLTTDDGLTRKANSIEGLRVKVVNPKEYVDKEVCQ